MKGSTTLPKYKDDDLLTLVQVADHFGYSLKYLRALSAENHRHSDPLLRRARIKTDPTWRKAFGSSAHYVYRYGELKTWFNDHQADPAVQAFNQGRGIIVDL